MFPVWALAKENEEIVKYVGKREIGDFHFIERLEQIFRVGMT